MKEIGDYIKKNKSFFNDAEPLTGHLDRFKTKLGGDSKKVTFFKSSVKYFRAASVIILIALSSLWIYEKFTKPAMKEQISLGEVSPEYKEVEFYYTRLYKTKLTELSGMKKIDPEVVVELKKDEFTELDSLYRVLQKDLGSNNNDERIINAMIEYYQTKVELLNQIILQLNNAKNDRNKRTGIPL
ncbi:MAG: hypothetical protein GXO79_14880 [Chlorobi bacterium]|nr:hypothetical protein [Chlorobiota bacterium]